MAFFNVLRSLSPTLILGRTTFQKSKVKAEKILMCRRRNFQEKKSFFKDLKKKKCVVLFIISNDDFSGIEKMVPNACTIMFKSCIVIHIQCCSSYITFMYC